ncbi:MAG: DUF2586 family protein [Meiothermus sp.]|uniref:DUF2586 domain-containing protein n=1 Tax=Meiothermus sp. TaxID=1955249 RepID=UPI0025FB6A38|nr:DUF2586 domain-containing protein [Meiothermus sp.]MCS7069095.1 DUF2586 family protein [Meiothermus sp.]
MPQPLLPDVWFDIQDGALGILPPPTDGVSAKIGVASAGPVNQIVAVTNLKQVQDTFGSGPLAEALATHLALSGAPVYAIRTNASVAGTVSSVTKTGSGTGSLAVSGAPLDAYQVQVELTRSGTNLAANTAAFRYTLDGGDNWSPEIALPVSGTYALPGTGLTLTFSDGGSGTSFAQGDQYSFTTTAPSYTLSDLNTSLDVLLGDPREWGWVHVVGEATPTIAAGVATKMQQAETNYRFAFALLEAADDTDANLLTAWNSFADKRVAVAGGYAELASPLTGRVQKRSVAWPASGRLAAIPVHEHLGRIISGPVQGVVSLYRDEAKTPGLDEKFFTTMRTVIGRDGHYFTRGRIKAPAGSDFQYLENRRVMDRACRIARNAALRYLNDNVRVDGSGNIYEPDARAIEAFVEGQLLAGLVSPGHASAVQVSLKRDSNVLSTRSTTLTVRVRPLGYLEYIQVDIGFANPALEAAAA